jgi:sensor histidine kinase YesM
MILQMLIENAIKHGIENLRHGGTVQLAAEATPKYITFKITNDIPHIEIPTTQSTGIGLRNIEQRLKLLYGSNATINTHEQNQKFIVTLTLPREIRQ